MNVLAIVILCLLVGILAPVLFAVCPFLWQCMKAIGWTVWQILKAIGLGIGKFFSWLFHRKTRRNTQKMTRREKREAKRRDREEGARLQAQLEAARQYRDTDGLGKET